MYTPWISHGLSSVAAFLKHAAGERYYTHREQLHAGVQRQVWLLPRGRRRIRPLFFTHTAGYSCCCLLGTLWDPRGKIFLCPNTAAACYHF